MNVLFFYQNLIPLQSNYDFSENDLEQDIVEYEKFLKSENKKQKSKTKHPLLEEYDSVIATLGNWNIKS